MPYAAQPGDRVSPTGIIFPACPPARRKFYVPELDTWFPLTREEKAVLRARVGSVQS